MNLTPIRELVKKTHQLDPQKLGRDTFIYVDISSVDKDTKKISAPQILSVNDAPSRARKEIKADDVLVATVRPNLNGVAIVPSQYSNQIASTGFCVLRADVQKLDPTYLFYFSQTDYFVSHLTELSTGAGYPAVSDEDILDTHIPLPLLPEQKRIAGLLARADRLRRLRRFTRAMGDSLLQSVFLEMFGDPIQNSHHFDKVEISELISDLRGGAPLEPEDFVEKGFPVLHKGAIKPEGLIELDTGKKTFTHEAFVKKHKKSVVNHKYVAVTLRDLVPSGPSIGLISKVEKGPYPEFILAQGAYAFLVNEKRVKAEYLVWLSNMPSFRRFLRTLAVGSTQIHIRTPIFAEISIPIPPLVEQENFVQIAHRYERMRTKQGESARQAEELFQGLLSKSFSQG